jgi:hypothetical protein
MTGTLAKIDDAVYDNHRVPDFFRAKSQSWNKPAAMLVAWYRQSWRGLKEN